MRRTIILVVAALSLMALAFASPKQFYGGQVQKPWDVSLGAIIFVDDLDNAGFDAGFTAGIDYYHGYLGENVMGFLGVRGWFASEASDDVTTYGLHYGIRVSLSQGSPQTGVFYLKAAGGYYRSEFTGSGPLPNDDEWGFGWFAGLGYEFTGGFTVEAGFQGAPEVSGTNNRGWYGTVGFRF
ncbi:MAG: outer membrane beta-barrel protein [Candidatus Caldarchaeum sp.]